jgi:WD40 repeat protein
LPETFHARMRVQEYFDFVRLQGNALSIYPEIILQQAFHYSHSSSPATEARTMLTSVDHDIILEEAFRADRIDLGIFNTTHSAGKQVSGLCFLDCDDGASFIFSASYDGSVQIFDTRQARLISVLYHDRPLLALACWKSIENIVVAAATRGGGICIWVGAVVGDGFISKKTTLDVGSDADMFLGRLGNTVAIACGRDVFVSDDAFSKISLKFEVASGISCMGASRDGHSLILGCDDQTVCVYDLDIQASSVHRHGVDITAVAVLHDKKLAASGLREPRGMLEAVQLFSGPIVLWDTETKESKGHLEGHPFGPISNLDFSNDGSKLISAAQDWQGPRVWDCSTFDCLVCFRAHGVHALVARISGDGERAVSGDVEGHIKCWQVPEKNSGILRRDNDNHVGTVRHIASCSSDEKLIISAGADKSVRLFSIGESGFRELGKYEVHTSDVNRLDIAYDCKTAVSASDDKSVKVWQIDSLGGSLQEVTSLIGSRGWIECVAMSKDGTLVAAGDNFGEVKIWTSTDRLSWTCIHTICSAEDFCRSPDSQSLKVTHATGSNIGCQSIGLSNTNSRLLVSRGDGMIGLYRIDQNCRTFSLLAHTEAHVITRQDGMVEAFLQFAPDGSTFLSTGDPRLRVWNVVNDKITALCEYRLDGEGRRLVVTQNRVAVSCWNGWVYIFDSPLHEVTNTCYPSLRLGGCN